jgi:adhesin transport system membrane fusion protein
MARGSADSDLLDLMPDVEAATRRSGGHFAYVLSFTVVVFLAVFVIWADWAVLDEVTRGDGQIIPSSRIQVIQNLEGGILAEVLINEGAMVNRGDILVRIDNVLAESTYRDARNQYLNHLAAMARLEAELEDRAPKWPAEVQQQMPAAVGDQKTLYDSRQRQLNATLSVLKLQVDQRRQEIGEMQSRKRQLENNLQLAKQQRDIAKPLAAQGLYPQVDFLRLEREVSSLDGDLSTLRLSIPRAENALREAEQRVGEQIATFKTQASDELNKRRGDARSLLETITASKDRVTRTEVRSPVRGIVKQIRQNTIGGVIRPGDDILEIVPLDDTLLVEARIRPADIAFLRPGQPAMIKITAYDFSIYGGLKASLEEISADTIKDEKGESFYRIRLRTEKNTLIHNKEALPIIPGMTVTVDILTGKKTVMDYLLKPILKAKERALRER